MMSRSLTTLLEHSAHYFHHIKQTPLQNLHHKKHFLKMVKYQNFQTQPKYSSWWMKVDAQRRLYTNSPPPPPPTPKKIGHHPVILYNSVFCFNRPLNCNIKRLQVMRSVLRKSHHHRLYSPGWALASAWGFVTIFFFFLQGEVVSLMPNPQPGGPGYPFLSGSSPLTCLPWEALPVAYATTSIALGIIW